MNTTELHTEAASDAALRLLEEAGIEFSVVCSGPEPSCPAGEIPQAA